MNGEGVFAGADGLKLYYRRYHSEAQPPRAALAVVGSPGSPSDLLPELTRQLLPRGYAIHCFQHREHVRAPGQRGHLEEWVQSQADVRAFVQIVGEQIPDCPLFLMGTGFAGFIALSLVLHEPTGLAGVIAVDPVSQPPPAPSFLGRLSRSLLHLWPRPLPETPVQVVSRWTARSMSPDPDVEPVYAGDLTLPHVILHGTDQEPSALVARLGAWLEEQRDIQAT